MSNTVEATLRGIQGIETPMVGRDTELRLLQGTYQAAMDENEMQVITVVGEPGVGKSRLLYEFQRWLAQQPDEVFIRRGRATPELSKLPFALLRNLIAARFNILESDSAEIVRAKLIDGIQPIVEDEAAPYFIGQLLGYDFSQEPMVASAANSRQLVDQAIGYMLQLLRQDAKLHSPTVLFIEDIHWADTASQEIIERLARSYQALPLLVVCLTRPSFIELNPRWGEGWLHHTRIDLRPLSETHSDQLLQAILSKASTIPAQLRDLIIHRADGNPFYLEELIKMLIEDGVISTGEDHWNVDLGRLSKIRVPETLTEVLQTRLSILSQAEYNTLQHAAVIGRVFWDSAVAYSAGASGGHREEIPPILDHLRGRELVFVRGTSSFAGVREYLFKHALLHEVTYQSVEMSARQRYHQLAAQWLEESSGDRVNEYLGLIASHYEQAGSVDAAVRFLTRAAEQALFITAYHVAETFLRRADAIIQQNPVSISPATRAYFDEYYGIYFYGIGEYSLSRQYLEESLALYRAVGQMDRLPLVMYYLGWVVGYILKETANGKQIFADGLALAEQIGHKRAMSRLYNGLGTIAGDEYDYELARKYYEQGLAIAEEINFLPGLGATINNLGEVEKVLENYSEATKYFERVLGMARNVNSPDGIAIALDNLGQVALAQKRYAQARTYLEEAAPYCQANGNRLLLANVMVTLSRVALSENKREEGIQHLTTAWELYNEIKAAQSGLVYLVTFGRWLAQQGKVVEALGLLHSLLAHPASTPALESAVNALLSELEAELPAEIVAQAQANARPFTVELLKEFLS